MANSTELRRYPVPTANVKSTSDVIVSLLSPSNSYSMSRNIISIGTEKWSEQNKYSEQN